MKKIERIIIEGADQQGKSTLCDALSKQLGWPVVHYGKPDQSFDFHDDYITPKFTISDRNFISEMVYSEINLKSPRIKDLRLLCDKLRDSTLIIHLDRGQDFKFEDREEAYSEYQINKARELYLKKISTLQVLYNIDVMSLVGYTPEQALKHVLFYINNYALIRVITSIWTYLALAIIIYIALF